MFLVSSCAGSGGLVVPIEIEDAQDVGGIAVQLSYDPAVLRATEVKTTSFTRGTDAAYNVDSPGVVVALVQKSAGLSGDGALVSIRFDVLNSGASTDLTLEVLQAKEANTGADLTAQAFSGSYSGPTGVFVAPRVQMVP